MIEYINYIEQEIFKIDIPYQNKDLLLTELRLYKEKYEQYKDCDNYSPIYHDNKNLDEIGIHNFNLPTGEAFTITWDIAQVYNKTLDELAIERKTLSLIQFNKLFHDEIIESKSELDEICEKFTTALSHTHENILGIYFRPFRTNIILDGWYRFVEHLKFHPNAQIPIFYTSSDTIMDCIIYKKDLVRYIILSNIEEIDSYLSGKGKLEHILNFEKCGL